jgi:hypothetical protein
MQRTTLQVHFTLKMPAGDYRALCAAAAPAIARTPGLHWKLFTLDERASTAAGLYLFADRASAEAYVASPIIAGLRSHPGIAELSIRMMGVDEELSRITAPDRSGLEGGSR